MIPARSFPSYIVAHRHDSEALRDLSEFIGRHAGERGIISLREVLDALQDWGRYDLAETARVAHASWLGRS